MRPARLLMALLTTLSATCVVVTPATARQLAKDDAADKGARLSPGAGDFMFSGWDGPPLRTYYSIPDAVTATTPVLIVMHGVRRDADRYRDEWRTLAQRGDLIVMAPQFVASDFPGTAGYNGGNFENSRGRPLPRPQWSFAAIEPLFDDIRRRTGTQVPSYAIYGHSAGAQFVHRFVLFIPEARYHQAIAANAGWYTLPDFALAFPYGLRGAPVDGTSVRAALERPLTILLGTADNDPNHENLRRTRLALAQGPHRLARGHTFLAAGRSAAEKLNVPFSWKLHEVPGVGHENGRMAVAAAQLLAGGDR